MNFAPRVSLMALACSAMLAMSGATEAQQPPGPVPGTPGSHPSAQSEAGEPRASTSPDAPAVPQATPPRSQAPDSHPRAPRTEQRVPPAKPATKAEGTRKGAATDRLELQTATVTGDREQPKVMYIVPWKKSDIGDLSGKPMNSLLDEALAPVDRDEFKREVMYYQAVRADAPQNGAAARGAPPAAPQR